MELKEDKLKLDDFSTERDAVLKSWPTGEDVDFDEGVKFQQSLPESKRFSTALIDADKNGKTLLQPRAGVALLDDQVELLTYLEDSCDLLPTTIDAYTRLNRYDEAAVGIDKSNLAGTSLLNGFPAVNHGMHVCRYLVNSLTKPVQVRHGTPDARLLAEITLAAGFTSFEGGGISYNIPYSKNVPLEQSIRHWQYCDRLVGMYEDEGVKINREPFGPLTGTLVPPFISHCVAILEGLLALQQGAKCITLGYGQAGNLVQDVAAISSLRHLANKYFQAAGFDDYQFSTVFHQWMGGFPEDESKAYAVICWGATSAAFAHATKVIVKTPHEASGIPTKEANREGLRATRQIVNMVSDQHFDYNREIEHETKIIEREVDAVLAKVFQLAEGDLVKGIVRAFESGVIDIPFAPASCNSGILMPVRDDHGAVRILDAGTVPLPDDVIAYHKEKLAERAETENRDVSFQMVIDDVNAISKSRLIGRPG